MADHKVIPINAAANVIVTLQQLPPQAFIYAAYTMGNNTDRGIVHTDKKLSHQAIIDLTHLFGLQTHLMMGRLGHEIDG